MSRYINFKCRDCGYEKFYSERFADGRSCPKCKSRLYLPSNKETNRHEAVEFVTKREYELLLKRFSHLLESNTIAMYDEVDPSTGKYKRDIKELDKIQTLRKLVDENAINFIVKNEKEFEEQYDLFINWNKAIIGIDFGSGRDITVYPRSK